MLLLPHNEQIAWIMSAAEAIPDRYRTSRAILGRVYLCCGEPDPYWSIEPNLRSLLSYSTQHVLLPRDIE